MTTNQIPDLDEEPRPELLTAAGRRHPHGVGSTPDRQVAGHRQRAAPSRQGGERVMTTWDDLVPADIDFARAMAAAAGWATGDTAAVDAALAGAQQDGRPIQVLLAALELLVRGHDLRDDEESMSRWRQQIADHLNRADGAGSE